MRTRSVWFGLASMFVLTWFGAVSAMAADAESGAGVPQDSAWYAPFVRHGWLEAGVAWTSGSDASRRNFEAGQGFGAGVEGMLRGRVRLRLGGDYQIFPSRGEGRVVYEGVDAFETAFVDTLHFPVRSPGCVVSLRAEAGIPGPGGSWIFGGGGPAWIDDGMGDMHQRLAADIVMHVQGAGRDGWAWFTTAGALCNLEGLLGFPLALDVRWRSVFRGDDDARFWTLRVGTLRP